MAARSASFAAALVLTAWLGLSAAAWADFKDGERAFDVGDYPPSMVGWRPLAEHGAGLGNFM